MEKINIAELLKDCPSGMELDCTMYDGVTLREVNINDDSYPIQIETKSGFCTILTKYGQNVTLDEAKCVIFPKGKTTWEGFQRPFKDGDVVATLASTQIFIFKEDAVNRDGSFSGVCYFGYDLWAKRLFKKGRFNFSRHATEEEKQKLFDAIKANGYKWNPKTKTLKKLIEPKFKVGDRIRHRLTGDVYRVSHVISNIYGGGVYDVEVTNELGKSINIKEQHLYELAPCETQQYDITTIEPGKVYWFQVTDDIKKNEMLLQDLLLKSQGGIQEGKRNQYNPGDLIYLQGDKMKICEYAKTSYYAIRMFGTEIKLTPKK